MLRTLSKLIENEQVEVSIDKDQKFNAYQNFLYGRALFGLSVYSPDELNKMSWQKKREIVRLQKHTQRVLNDWKQEILSAQMSSLIYRLFSRSKLANELKENFASISDPNYICKLEFRDLGLTKSDIVVKLIREGILPKDFTKLKANE